MKSFSYESYTEWYGKYVTITKIYADIPQEAADIIGKAEKWDGCHWDKPDIIYSENYDGIDTMSPEAANLIDILQATERK